MKLSDFCIRLMVRSYVIRCRLNRLIPYKYLYTIICFLINVFQEFCLFKLIGLIHESNWYFCHHPHHPPNHLFFYSFVEMNPHSICVVYLLIKIFFVVFVSIFFFYNFLEKEIFMHNMNIDEDRWSTVVLAEWVCTV